MLVLTRVFLSSSVLLLPLGCNVVSEAPERFAAAGQTAEVEPPPAPVLAPEMRFPGGIPLEVRETAGIPRREEVARSGVPLPRALGVRHLRSLAVVDAAGHPVPADFRVLARWNAGLDQANAPVQWLLVAFPASVGAHGKAVYRLVTDGSVANPPPPRPLRLTSQGDRITIDTGAAVFRLGDDPGALFDEVRSTGASGNRLTAGSEISLTTQGRTGPHPGLRRVRIEHAGPLSAAVVVDGAYDLPEVGKGGFGSRRRYLFTAGSPTAIVRHAVSWEGNLACRGCIQTKDGRPNGVLIERARDMLALDLRNVSPDGDLAVTAVGDFAAPAVERTVRTGAGQAELARIRQRLRPQREAPLAFDLEVAGQSSRGDRADGGMLAVTGPRGGLAVALSRMHRYEPQALRLLADGRLARLAIDLADDRVWLSHHQGMFATFAVTALAARPSRSDLDRLVWAPLNRPLRPWPGAAWFSGSQAVAEVPAGKLPRGLAAYDDLVPNVLDATSEAVDREGIAGLMTFGVYPRYWGRWGSPELKCKRDPTPQEHWDDTFWCSTWTDYHNTLATASIWAMRSGEVERLDEMAFPGALRTLHTQMMQCGPDERWFYCGQAPAGYAAYRSDFNSSHAYLDNLYLYYWLTGDSTVVDTLQRGGENMRRRMCPSRGRQPVAGELGPEGPACPAGEPPGDAGFSGRVGAQWLAALRFLGLASPDASFLDDWRSGLARMLTHQYAELERNGETYGFLGDAVGAAGPLWTVAFYDAENLYRYQIETGDQALGEPPVRPSRALAALARTVADLEEQSGPWPRLLTYTFDGPRLGGRLVELTPKDRKLYGPEKAGSTALLVRAGQQTGDRKLLAAGEAMVRLALSASRGEQVPLGKLQGQYLSRLHAAVARLANGRK